MAEPLPYYVDDIKKYTGSVNEAAVQGIVKHLGIALHKKDSSLVSASDPEERKRVRDGFMKKKLALTDSDADLEKSLGAVLDKMKADKTKERVTVCYLLAEHYGKLDAFVKA